LFIGLSLGVSLGAGTLTAQPVDHDRIERLFDIVEGSAPQPFTDEQSTSSTALITQSATDGPAPAPPPPVQIAPEETTAEAMGPELFAYELPDGSGCPRDPRGFSAAIDELEAKEETFADQVAGVERMFDELTEAVIEARSFDDLSCPDALLDQVENLDAALAEFDAGADLAWTENLGLCAQNAVTRIDAAMDKVRSGAPDAPDVSLETLTRRFNFASTQDARLTDVMVDLAKLHQKQLRLVSASEKIAKDCSEMDDSMFGMDDSMFGSE
jgi:hypothetical protein